MEAVAVIHGKDDGGFDSGGRSKDVEKWADSGYILHIEPREFLLLD